MGSATILHQPVPMPFANLDVNTLSGVTHRISTDNYFVYVAAVVIMCMHWVHFGIGVHHTGAGRIIFERVWLNIQLYRTATRNVLTLLKCDWMKCSRCDRAKSNNNNNNNEEIDTEKSKQTEYMGWLSHVVSLQCKQQANSIKSLARTWYRWFFLAYVYLSDVIPTPIKVTLIVFTI